MALYRLLDGSDINLSRISTGAPLMTNVWRRLIDAYGNDHLIGPTGGALPGVVVNRDLKMAQGEDLFANANLGG